MVKVYRVTKHVLVETGGMLAYEDFSAPPTFHFFTSHYDGKAVVVIWEAIYRDNSENLRPEERVI